VCPSQVNGQSAVKIGLALRQFHVMYKAGHCLGTPQACIRGLGVKISTVLVIIACSLTQGTRIYMVYGWVSQRFSRQWISSLRGTEPFHMVMISIPSNAP
jgi:hypothetical protein